MCNISRVYSSGVLVLLFYRASEYTSVFGCSIHSFDVPCRNSRTYTGFMLAVIHEAYTDLISSPSSLDDLLIYITGAPWSVSAGVQFSMFSLTPVFSSHTLCVSVDCVCVCSI